MSEIGVWLGQVKVLKGAPGVLRVALSYSRKAYSEAVFHQTTEDFVRCPGNALRVFGGSVTLNQIRPFEKVSLNGRANSTPSKQRKRSFL